ncbi:MAG: hypothetical protein WCS77_09125 [Elusimicrobiaceae bacterium]
MHSIALSFAQAKYTFKDATAELPSEPGKHNMLGARYAYTLDRNGGLSRMRGSFGSIFGLGLSDLEERLKPRDNIGCSQNFEARGLHSGNFIGSDYDFSIAQFDWRAVWEFPKRDRINIRVTGVKGWNMPFTQLIATGDTTGLRGQYRREWRGDQGAGASASFSFFMFRTKRGMLVAEPFAETAFVWNGNARYQQTGAGLNFYYQFWRFPMPLGIGVTQSMTDHTFVISAAAGFNFGR